MGENKLIKKNFKNKESQYSLEDGLVVIFAGLNWRQNAEVRAQLVLTEHLEEDSLKGFQFE